MFCHNCGIKLPEDADFCYNCGTKVVREIDGSQVSDCEHPKDITDTETFAPAGTKVGSKKIHNVGLLTGLASLIFLIVLVAVLIRYSDTITDWINKIEAQATSGYEQQTSASGSSSVSSESSFAWVEDAYMITEGEYNQRYIVGAIKNVSDTTFSYVNIYFVMYDLDGNQVDTATSFISNFKSGNTWKFKIQIYSDNVSYFEFSHATKQY